LQIKLALNFFSDASEKNWEPLNPHGIVEVAIVPLNADLSSKLKVMYNLAKELLTKDSDVFVQGISGKFFGIIRKHFFGLCC